MRRVFVDCFPSSLTSTLCLLRRRVRLSRELTDDVVRARGHKVQLDDRYADVVASIFDDKYHGRTYARLWSGVREIIPYVDGKRHGLACSFYCNGNRLAEVPYVNSQRHGLSRRWHAHGTLAVEERHVDNWIHGYERKWREDGTLFEENLWSHGHLQSTLNWAFTTFACHDMQGH